MNSQLVVLALVVVCGALSVNGSAAATYIQSKADRTLMNYMAQSRAGGPDMMACFDYYTPIMNGITDDYQKNYEACETTEKSQLAALLDLGSEARDNITKSSNEVCAEFQSCQANTDNLAFFDCYTNSGDESVRQIYADSQDASEAAANYRETYRMIEVQSEGCKNKSQNTYVTDTAKAYDDLGDCLANGLKVTDAPATDAPATDAPATDAPATDAPATDAPATDAPATDAPATDAPATDAPATDAPATDAPATDAPATDAPATDAPATDAPATDAPATDAPATDAPATDAPATDAPATDAPATDAPATDAPATDASVTDSTEKDQVEELKQNSIRSQLQQLVSSWGKRFA